MTNSHGAAKNGQHMTPQYIVDFMLNNIGYNGEQILRKKIMEPSFGDGVFLCEIVRRLICVAKGEKFNNGQIANLLQNNIFGIEKDENLYLACISNLNRVLAKEHIVGVNWKKNLKKGDTLELFYSTLNSFDYVVGNPPYIRIHDMSEKSRKATEKLWFSQGMQDLYISFYEMGIRMLRSNGVMSYISPNSFLKNASQKQFRQYLIDKELIDKIYDFKSIKIFDNADTYTCITVLSKSNEQPSQKSKMLTGQQGDCPVDLKYAARSPKENGIYYAALNGAMKAIEENHWSREEFADQFSNRPWILTSASKSSVLISTWKSKAKLRDVSAVQNGIATNKDSLYVIRAFSNKKLTSPVSWEWIHTQENVYFADETGKTHKIETAILRPCVKASKYCGISDNTFIIFPYVCPGKKCKIIEENQMMEEFPNAYAYLSANREVLLRRNMEQGTVWYAFARSQGINQINKDKIVFKHIIPCNAKTTAAWVLPAGTAVYSGLFVTEKENDKLSLFDICQVIQSEAFTQYCILAGKDMSGGYVGVNSTIVGNFGIDSYLRQKQNFTVNS